MGNSDTKLDDDAKRALREAQSALEHILEDENAFKEAVQRSVRQFAHDIKNPLTAMIGYSKLMASGKLEPETFPENSEIIHKAALRMLNLCESMVENSERMDPEDNEIPEDQIQDVDAVEILEEVETLFGEMAAEREINLISNIAEDFPTLHTVPTHLYRSLTNIMSNAMKFTPGGGEIAINAEVDEADEAVIFVVRDSGAGIPAKQIPQILQPYKTTVSPHGDKGTGLGLPIVNQLMMELGGKMEISSRENEGTTVKLRFPKNLMR